MSIKIFKAFPMYGDYLDAFYNNYPFLKEMPFEKQLAALRQDCFTRNILWGVHNKHSDIAVFETVWNARHLQKAYCGGCFPTCVNWEKEVILKQICDYQPDVCVLYPPEFFDIDFVNMVRNISHTKVVIGSYDGMNRENISLYTGFDFVMTCSDYISLFYIKNGMIAYTMPFGFDPVVLKRIHNRKTKYRVSFSGSLFEGIHNNRFELIKYLIWRAPLTISSSIESSKKYSFFSRRFLRSVKQNNLYAFLTNYMIQKNNIGSQYGIDMFQFLKDSKMTLNMHGDRVFFAANIRLYEATGVGTCLLTDWKDNLGDLFEPDKEVVTYVSNEEAADKIHFLLRHDDIRRKIAENGQKRTLAMYNEVDRSNEAISFIKSIL